MLSSGGLRYVLKRTISKFAAGTSSELPKYPPILDLSDKAIEKRKREKYRDRINSLDSIEEKLFFQNLNYYYGSECVMLKEGELPMGFLPFAKFATRTKTFAVDEKMFLQLIKNNADEAKELLERIRPLLQEALLFELLGRANKSTPLTNLIETMNSVLLSGLSMQYQHLLDSTVDFNPRVEAFWLAGNFHPSPQLREQREKKKDKLKANKWLAKPSKVEDIDVDETVEHFVQYVSKPVVQVRCKVPLSQLDTRLLENREDELQLETDFSEDHFSPVLQYGLELTRRHGTNLPGFWPGDESEFGIISYHQMYRNSAVPEMMREEENKSAMVSQAVLNSYSWLHAQAALSGFSTYSELTYPLTNQQVITDGRRFFFSLYQLNTTLIHKRLFSPNTRTNLCVTLPEVSLYDKIENNQFVGWNDSVLLTLLALYLNKPQPRENVEMKPHVNPRINVMSNIEDPERRKWLHNQFRHMYSNRPRHMLPYEIFDWERIYKIAYETRGMEAKSRPFEREQNPMEERKYWDFLPAYIPKQFRPKKKHWRGWRAKKVTTYFPEP